ncbi:hypothetical protein [Cryobacterium sp. TMT2-14]|uniref:hypothetical protein n=1 Tax=Cryobacterium sp. TMT2-14 TaxID=1259245 RepID=UPI00106C0EF1|nr:hypothetical protein [Cryobacterium sp. TMT2-14]TFC37541.1 hypothetical protein E3O28_06025 [Cryobacterium sp. TMT2-14]
MLPVRQLRGILLRPRPDETGSALMAVIGVMAVTAIIAVTVSAATINALGYTTTSRASVQARAAADAGIDVAIRDLRTTNGCATDINGQFKSIPGDVPSYDVLLEHLDPVLGWVVGCPDAQSTSMRITSTGAAQSLEVAGNRLGDSATLEAVYAYVPVIVQVPLDGVAVYAYTVDGVLKKFVLSSADNSVATSIMVRTGDVECSNNAKIGGDLVLGDGSATMDMCDVAGSVQVSDDITMNKSNIGGNVSAGGLVTQTNSVIGGVVTSGPTVAAPVVPNWVDVGYDPAKWVAQGYNVVNWTGSCSIAKNNTAWTNLKNYTHPTVVNFRTKCPGAVTTSNNMDWVTLNTDLVLIANEFVFDRLYFKSLVNEHQLSFIVPDNVADGNPTCVAPSGGVTLSNETDFGLNISAMIYTPCKVYSDRNGFRGQIYGGEVEFAQQAQLTFVPVGISGFDLSGGVTVPKITGAELGDLTSRRQLAGGD